MCDTHVFLNHMTLIISFHLIIWHSSEWLFQWSRNVCYHTDIHIRHHFQNITNQNQCDAMVTLQKWICLSCQYWLSNDDFQFLVEIFVISFNWVKSFDSYSNPLQENIEIFFSNIVKIVRPINLVLTILA